MTRRGPHSFASEQALGGGRQAVQQDRVRVEGARTADGQRLLLAVVADGDGHRRAGEAAEAVIQKVFEAIGEAQSHSLAAALRGGLEAGGRAVAEGVGKWEGRASVAATAVAVWRGRVFVASAGHTRVYRVREGRTSPISPIDSRLLGAPAPCPIWTSDADGLALLPGDQLVLASDGLTQTSPEDGRPYLDPGDLARHTTGNPPLEGARHLISMALGRDALDNVTVAVIQMAAEKRLPRRALAAALAITLLALVALAIALMRRGTSPSATQQPATDLGYAVIVGGSAEIRNPSGQGQSVANLGTIAAGQALTALDDLRLVLQTRAGANADIATLTYYLAEGASIELTVLDAQPGGGQSVVTLAGGRLLMERSGGSRGANILCGEVRVGFGAAGAGAVGVAADSSGITVDCLIGDCTVELADVGTRIDAPGEVSVSGASVGPSVVIPADEIRVWDALCGGCLPSP